MSSAEPNPQEPTEPIKPGPSLGPTAGPGLDSSRGSPALLAVLLAALAVLAWALNPRQPKLRPAPLQPPPSRCPVSHAGFVPTNITEVPGLRLEPLSKTALNRALLRLNMEPCSCGCNQSLAACRMADRACSASARAAKQVVDDEGSNAAPEAP